MVAVATLSEVDRDDLIQCCKGIAEIVEWLDSIDGRPGLSELDTRLSTLPVNLDALNRHIGYTDDDGYQRNIIKKTENYEMVAITWKPGQKTPIHDHKGSDCAFLIVDGIATETIYNLNDDGFAEYSSARNYVPGEVCAAEEPDIHRISNDENCNLINLHVYTPPLSEFGIFSPAE
ncbi:MAG: cysteine dioxygenase family protein [Candidatus Thalassarchaeaceae archaeon]|jgi:cysteine dioxygenase|nr:cysteine dioxygenase family protein [Candidatus Thalassarchaeaceae archaeon]